MLGVRERRTRLGEEGERGERDLGERGWIPIVFIVSGCITNTNDTTNVLWIQLIQNTNTFNTNTNIIIVWIRLICIIYWI